MHMEEKRNDVAGNENETRIVLLCVEQLNCMEGISNPR